MAKKKLTDKEVQSLTADCLAHFKDTMIGAGATSTQMIEAAQHIAMAITLEGVGSGPGSRWALNEIVSGLAPAYLNEWERVVYNLDEK